MTKNHQSMKIHGFNPLKTLPIAIFLALAFTINGWASYIKEINLKKDLSATYYEPQVFKLPPGLEAIADLAESRSRPLTATGTPQEIKPAEEKPARSGSILPILMYHYVDALAPGQNSLRKKLTTPPAVLEKQLKTLNDAGYQSLFVRDAAVIIARGPLPSGKAVAMTFDDGYEDFYTVVFPLLKKYHSKATVYVIYDSIGAPGYLNEQQIKNLADSGLVEIGSHTLDHRNLTVQYEAEAKRQLTLSKDQLQKRLRLLIETVAYPFGAFNARIASLAEAAGYRAAVSVIPGNRQTASDLYYLRRLRPGYLSGGALINFLEK